MRKRKIIFGLAFISLTMFIIISHVYNQEENSIDLNNPTDHANEKNEESEEEKTTEVLIDEKPKTPAEEISKEFSSLIRRTIGFFSNDNKHIVAIGDSLTQGIGDNTKQGGYVGLLNKQLNADKQVVTIDNFGKKGNRTKQMLDRLENREIIDSVKKADMVLITIGANDIMQVVRENFMEITYDIFTEKRDHYERRLQQVFTEINNLNPNATVYLIGFYNPFEKYFQHIEELDMIVDDWNNSSKEVAEQSGAIFIPTKDLFVESKVNLFAEDNFHPNEIGYRRIAERVLNYLVIE